MDLPLPAPPSSNGPASPTWRQRWQAWRDSVLISPNFQRRAARSWWMRPIARRRARGLFDLVAGFVYSQVLLACVRLRLFDILASGPRSAVELAAQLDLPADSTERLLAAAVSLELLDVRPGHPLPVYGLGKLGAPMVGNTAIAAMVEHHAVLYADLQDPVALLRGQRPGAHAGANSGAAFSGTAISGGATPSGASGKATDGPALSRFWAYATAAAPAALAPEQVNEYSALMSASQPLVAAEVLDTYDFSRHRCLLDVGGGQGRFLGAVAAQVPHLKLMLFDLPGVVPVARHAFAAAGLAERTTVYGGDFTKDALPTGADVASLVRVIYDHPDERALAILRAVFKALPPGGTLLLAEPMAGARGAPRMGDAYFGFYLLAMRGGRSRTAAELMALMQLAGFERARELATPIPLQVGVLVAQKPG
jgi:demethylspheroidene O-methyltransferase